jgi:hypothetical protein
MCVSYTDSHNRITNTIITNLRYVYFEFYASYNTE